MKPFDQAAGYAPDISTQAEYLARLRARSKPEATLDLTPDGPDFGAMLVKSDRANEARIAKLRSSLDDAQSKFRRDHGFER